MANRRFIDFPIATTVGDSDIILIWQSGVNKQTTKATFLSGLPENLEDLNDVVISGLTNGQILRYDSVTGKWENTDQGNLDLNDLNDVSIVSPSNGQVLVYNSSTSKWENSSGGFVPYVGAVTTVDLGAQGLRSGYVRFDTSVASVPNEQGLMYWDASRSTAALIMNGTLQHIGQDSFFYVKNSSGSTIPKGTCVGFAGTDGASGHLLVTPFLANGSVPSTYFIGVTAEAITNGSFGQVMHFGELEGINTSSFTAGALLYASTTVAGGFQTTVPVAPNNIVLVAAAVNSKNNGAIVVRPTYGSNINIDEGVKITSPTTGDLLQLQAGGLWENKTIDGAGIVTKATSQVISGLKTFNVNTLMMQSSGNANAVYLSNSSGSSTYQSGFNFFGFNTDNHIYFAKSSITGVNTGILAWTNTATRTYTLKDASGTLAFTSDIPANPVGGTGTTNYLPKFTGSTTIGNSQIFDNGTSVGIGTVSPQTVSSGFTLTVGDGATQQQPYLALSRNSLGGFWAGIRWYDGNTIKSVIQEDSDFNLRFSTSNAERLRITSGGNLLVGTTTDNGARLQVNGNVYIARSSNPYLTIDDTGVNSEGGILFKPSGFNSKGGLTINYSTAEQRLFVGEGGNSYFQTFYTNGSERLRITSSGNLGLGVTPSAWGSLFNNSLLQVKTTSMLGFDNNLYLGVNYYATNLSDNYIQNGFASRYVQRIGQHQWETAPSGTANGAVSFTQAMTLTSGGNLLVGTTTDNGARLQVSGTAQATKLVSASNSFAGTLDFGTGAFKGIMDYTASTGLWSLNNQTAGASSTAYFQFQADSNPILTMLKSGNVGIGTSSPGRQLEVYSATSDTRIAITNTTSTSGAAKGFELLLAGSDAYAFNYVNGAMIFGTNSTERMRITSGGNVLIGTTTDNGARLQVSGRGTFIADGAGNANSGISGSQLVLSRTSGLAENVAFRNTGGSNGIGGTNFAGQIISNGNNIFEIYVTGAQPMIFGTNSTERIRITSGAAVGIGKTSSITGLDIFMSSADVVNARTGQGAGTATSLFTGWNSASATTSGTLVFNVTSNGNVTNTNGSYGTLSDISLKENIKDATPKLEDILKLKVKNFNFIGSDEKQIGFIAQELEEIFPKLVDVNGIDKMKSIKTTVLIPMLVKAIQELKQEIDTLKN